MAEPRQPLWKSASTKDESFPTLLRELRDLVIAYVKQQTLVPLKQLGRYVAYGLAGGILITLGVLIVALGFLRALQSEAGKHLGGNWSWVPYLVVFAFLVAIAVLMARLISKAPPKEER